MIVRERCLFNSTLKDVFSNQFCKVSFRKKITIVNTVAPCKRLNGFKVIQGHLSEVLANEAVRISLKLTANRRNEKRCPYKLMRFLH